MTVLNKADSYLSLFITAHAQNKQFFKIEIGNIKIRFIKQFFRIDVPVIMSYRKLTGMK